MAEITAEHLARHLELMQDCEKRNAIAWQKTNKKFNYVGLLVVVFFVVLVVVIVPNFHNILVLVKNSIYGM